MSVRFDVLEGIDLGWVKLKVIEGHERSWKVKEGQGSSWIVFSHH